MIKKSLTYDNKGAAIFPVSDCWSRKLTFAIISLALLTFLLTLSSSAQTSAAGNRSNTAEPNASNQMTIEERMAYFLEGEKLFNKELFSQSIPHLEAAALNIESIREDNPQLFDSVLGLLLTAYWEVGRDSDANDVAIRMSVQNDGFVDTNFIPVDSAYLHPLSQLTCPKILDRKVRDKVIAFKPDGSDVACTYRKLVPENNLISFYVTYAPGRTSAVNHSSVSEMLRSRSPNARWLTETKELNFYAPNDSPILESVYLLNENTDSATYSGLWTSEVQGWQIKSRVTWDADLGRSFGRDAIRSSFTSLISDLPKHQKSCDSLKLPTEDVQTENNMEATLFAALLADKNVIIARPKQACLESALSNGNILLQSHYDDVVLYSFQGPAIHASFIVLDIGKLSLVDENSSLYVLVEGVTADDGRLEKLTILETYRGKPSSSQAFDDLIFYSQGDLKHDGIVQYDADGNTKITVDPKQLDNKGDEQ